MTDFNSPNGEFTAPSLKRLSSKQNLIVSDGTFHLDGSDGATTVAGGFNVKQIIGGSFFFEGDVGRTSVGGVQNDDFMFVARGETKGFSTKDNLAGTMYTVDLGTLSARGRTDDFDLLVGVDVGPDGDLGGGDDVFKQGSAAKSVRLSDGQDVRLRFGQNPVDGVLENGNDEIDDTASLRSFRAGTLDGAPLADTFLVVGTPPRKVDELPFFSAEPIVLNAPPEILRIELGQRHGH